MNVARVCMVVYMTRWLINKLIDRHICRPKNTPHIHAKISHTRTKFDRVSWPRENGEISRDRRREQSTLFIAYIKEMVRTINIRTKLVTYTPYWKSFTYWRFGRHFYHVLCICFLNIEKLIYAFSKLLILLLLYYFFVRHQGVLTVRSVSR